MKYATKLQGNKTIMRTSLRSVGQEDKAGQYKSFSSLISAYFFLFVSAAELNWTDILHPCLFFISKLSPPLPTVPLLLPIPRNKHSDQPHRHCTAHHPNHQPSPLVHPFQGIPNHDMTGNAVQCVGVAVATPFTLYRQLRFVCYSFKLFKLFKPDPPSRSSKPTTPTERQKSWNDVRAAYSD